jgi:hypothetical protein
MVIVSFRKRGILITDVSGLACIWPTIFVKHECIRQSSSNPCKVEYSGKHHGNVIDIMLS